MLTIATRPILVTIWNIYKANCGIDFFPIVWTRLSIVKKSDCAAVVGIQGTDSACQLSQVTR